jgi:transketolase
MFNNTDTKVRKLRNEFADTMLEVGAIDKDLVVMVGDISHGILQPFAKANEDRYFNIGICEPSMVNLASGLSKVGLTPVIHTIAPFITERSYEQIKLDFGYQDLSVNIISVGGSFDYSQLGCSHHCYTDVSLFAHLSKSNIVVPGSAKELNIIFKEIYKQNKINYIRLTENPHGIDFETSDIKLGKAIKVNEGSDITIAALGPQLKNAILAQKKLENEHNISAEVIYYHTFKPFDSKSIIASVSKTKHLLTLEELSAHDGLYNQCIKSLIQVNDVRYCQMAVKDFIRGYGSYHELCESAGLDLSSIINNSLQLINKDK